MKTKKEPFWKQNDPQIGKTQENHYIFQPNVGNKHSQIEKKQEDNYIFQPNVGNKHLQIEKT